MIFVAGHSNGAMMAYRFGAEFSNKIAAIASVSGSIGGKPTENSELYIIPKPSEPISVIVFHGKKDKLVLYDGGEIIYGFIKIDLSVQEAISFWPGSKYADYDEPTQELSASEIIWDFFKPKFNSKTSFLAL